MSVCPLSVIHTSTEMNFWANLSPVELLSTLYHFFLGLILKIENFQFQLFFSAAKAYLGLMDYLEAIY